MSGPNVEKAVSAWIAEGGGPIRRHAAEFGAPYRETLVRIDSATARPSEFATCSECRERFRFKTDLMGHPGAVARRTRLGWRSPDRPPRVCARCAEVEWRHRRRAG